MKADVLSLGTMGRSERTVGESLPNVRNKARAGEDVIVCLMTHQLHDVFTVAFSKNYVMQG
jgi:hypothetical protein